MEQDGVFYFRAQIQLLSSLLIWCTKVYKASKAQKELRSVNLSVATKTDKITSFDLPWHPVSESIIYLEEDCDYGVYYLKQVDEDVYLAKYTPVNIAWSKRVIAPVVCP